MNLFKSLEYLLKLNIYNFCDRCSCGGPECSYDCNNFKLSFYYMPSINFDNSLLYIEMVKSGILI